ncbi:MAG: holo-ACP synthase [bacterium]
MIYGIGNDIIEISKIKKSILSSNGAFLMRVFTDYEIKYCNSKKNRYQHYAVRFAAKEALMKAIGIGWQKGVKWKDVEVRNGELGKPTLNLYGKVKQLVDEMGVRNVLVTLSHCEEYAVAEVVLEN